MNTPQETPEQAVRRLAANQFREGYELQALHSYTTGDGAVIYFRIRLKNPTTGAKWIRPMTLVDGLFVFREPAFVSGKLLYRLHEIAAHPDAAVYITEGERCADTLAELGLVATTSGAADSAAAADWAPLRRPDAVIWPDNDAPGRRYATDVASRLLALGCAVRIMDVAGLALPHKGDAVDWFAATPHATKAAVESLPSAPAQLNQTPGAPRESATPSSALEMARAAVNALGAGSTLDEVSEAVRQMVDTITQSPRNVQAVERERTIAAIKRAGISSPARFWDEWFAARAGNTAEPETAGRRLVDSDPTPASDQQDTAQLLDEIAATLIGTSYCRAGPAVPSHCGCSTRGVSRLRNSRPAYCSPRRRNDAARQRLSVFCNCSAAARSCRPTLPLPPSSAR